MGQIELSFGENHKSVSLLVLEIFVVKVRGICEWLKLKYILGFDFHHKLSLKSLGMAKYRISISEVITFIFYFFEMN